MISKEARLNKNQALAADEGATRVEEIDAVGHAPSRLKRGSLGGRGREGTHSMKRAAERSRGSVLWQARGSLVATVEACGDPFVATRN